MHGFQVQQSRWAKGLTQCSKKLLPMIFRAKIPFRVKAEAFDALEFHWTEELAVNLEPFKWNELTLELSGVGSCVDWDPLVDWFEKWFDGDEKLKPGSDGLCGVVHFLSDPETKDDGVHFMIDLGSAPVEAFEELLDAVDALGAPRVKIS